ncbi:branched-chain amino acid ABC transporter permease [Candidatus Dormiibacter inghamiae]|uniref:branched-chain amino acid ABC transporter permease n=1 Tax=Candidatus Dormiibacter inghamiae TaxID=3127013 RepID=UPI001A1FE504|nr:branched-chain amino acid ABC transporter permease [Candidatus Dormibacteraeota bacterium]
MARADLRRFAPVAAVGLLLFVYPFVVKDAFWQNVAVLALVSASAAAAWNLLGGITGQVSFGHSIFYGTGAYTTGYLLVRYGLSPWVGMAAGCLVAVALGIVIGFPVFRLRSHYFSIATIAMQQVIFIIVVNNKALGAATGIELPLREASLANLQFSTRDLLPYHLIALALLGVSSLAIWLFMQGKAGAYVKAIRDDEDVARAMGVPVRRYKLYALALSAAITSLAGSYYGMYSLFIDPNVVLSLNLSIAIVLVGVLGGAGSLWGPLVGAWVLQVIQEETRVRLSGAGNALDLVIYGLLVMLIAVVEPAGLIGIGRRLARRLPVRRRAVQR